MVKYLTMSLVAGAAFLTLSTQGSAQGAGQRPARAATVSAAPGNNATGIKQGTKRHWRTYRSSSGGYWIRYPASWKVAEGTGAGGTIRTVFASPLGGSLVSVTMLNPDAPGSDIPTGGCFPRAPGKTGVLCTYSSPERVVFTTTSHDRVYSISASKNVPRAILQQMVKSFRVG